MNKILELKLEDLEFKKFSDLPRIKENDSEGINEFLNHFDQNINKSNHYYIIIYKKTIAGKQLKLLSPKLYFDLDYIKMKIYLNGYLKLNHNSTFSSYSFDTSIFNKQ